MNNTHFSGKTVFITGAASGIGYETCIAFAKAGADIVATDIDESALLELCHVIRTLGRDCVHFVLDVSDAVAFEAVASELKRIERVPHIVVNNAGIGYLGSFMEHDANTWRRIFDINLMGVVNGCRAFLPVLKASSDVRYLINIASLASLAPVPNMCAYAASKYAVHGLNEVLAMELADTNIKVLSVHPGIVSTAIVRSPNSIAASISESQLQKLQRYYREQGCHPSVVAEDIVAAVKAEKTQLFTGALARSTAWLKRFFSAARFRQLLLKNARNVGYLP